VSEVLLGNDVEQTKLALAAMTEGRNTHIVGKVDELLVEPKKAAPVIREVLAFFRAVPEAVHEEEVKLLIGLAGNSSDMQVEDRIEILGTISYTGIKLSPDLRRAWRGSRRRATGASARRRSSRSCAWATAARARTCSRSTTTACAATEAGASRSPTAATVLYRIRDWDAAAKDYMQALVIQNNNQDASAKPELYIGLAKSYAMLGKLKESSDWLEKAPIGFEELKTLAQDPAFAKLKEHPKYGSIFRGAAGN
jgi:tetratricopeptide (TPR) repeat protein